MDALKEVANQWSEDLNNLVGLFGLEHQGGQQSDYPIGRDVNQQAGL
jgi:hypothetical protein